MQGLSLFSPLLISFQSQELEPPIRKSIFDIFHRKHSRTPCRICTSYDCTLRTSLPKICRTGTACTWLLWRTPRTSDQPCSGLWPLDTLCMINLDAILHGRWDNISFCNWGRWSHSYLDLLDKWRRICSWGWDTRTCHSGEIGLGTGNSSHICHTPE